MLRQIESRVTSAVLRAAAGSSWDRDCDRRGMLAKVAGITFGTLAGMAVTAKPILAFDCPQPNVDPCDEFGSGYCNEIDPCTQTPCEMCAPPGGCNSQSSCLENCPTTGFMWAECDFGFACYCLQTESPCPDC
jgi:hypothetical protein